MSEVFIKISHLNEVKKILFRFEEGESLSFEILTHQSRQSFPSLSDEEFIFSFVDEDKDVISCSKDEDVRESLRIMMSQKRTPKFSVVVVSSNSSLLARAIDFTESAAEIVGDVGENLLQKMSSTIQSVEESADDLTDFASATSPVLSFFRGDNFSWEKYSSLMKAAALDDLQQVEFIVESASPAAALEMMNERMGSNESSALMMAAQANNIRVLEYLLSKGANVNLVNDIGNTALIIAAEEGHIRCAKALVKAQADVNIQNRYGQTALILATENGHFSILRWLTTIDPQQLTVVNKYGKNALLVGCEFGKDEIVKWLVERPEVNINLCTPRGYSALMYACSGGSDEHENCVDHLLRKNADVHHVSNNVEGVASGDGDTPLLWSVVGQRPSVTKKILAAGADSHIVNNGATAHNNFSALTKAAHGGLFEIVKVLVEHRSPISDEEFEVEMEEALIQSITGAVNSSNMQSENQGHLDVYNYLLKQTSLSEEKKETILADNFLPFVLNAETDDSLFEIYMNAPHLKSLQAFLQQSGVYSKWLCFESFTYLLPRFPRPSEAIRHHLPLFFAGLLEDCDSSDPFILNELVKLASAIDVAAAEYPLERIELTSQFKKIEQMINAFLETEAMHKSDTVKSVLCCHANESKLKNELVSKAEAFLKGPLHDSLETGIETIFHSTSVSTYVDDVFWGILRIGEHRTWFPHHVPFLPKFYFSEEAWKLRYLKSNLLYARYCPASMFFFEGVGRLLLLILAVYISVHLYNTSPYDYDQDMSGVEINMWEYVLVAFEFSVVVCEWGQLCGNEIIVPKIRNIRNYAKDIWNSMDIGAAICITIWAVLRFSITRSTVVQTDSNNFRASLGVSLGFLTFGFLRYLSIYEPLGKLVLMATQMGASLWSVTVVWVVCVFGLCVMLMSLFQNEFRYNSPWMAFSTVFAFIFGNYDFAYISSQDPLFSIGAAIMLIAIVMCGLILINLVIARMSATHAEVEARSFEKWQFTKAKTVQQYLLLEERRPDSMLPPPLNLFPVIFTPLHYFWILTSTRTRHSDRSGFLSISGTVSDITIGIIMAFIAPVFELIFYLRALSRRRESLSLANNAPAGPHKDVDFTSSKTNLSLSSFDEFTHRHQVKLVKAHVVESPALLSKKSAQLPSKTTSFPPWAIVIEALCAVLFFPVIYVFYVCSLVIEALLIRTYVLRHSPDRKNKKIQKLSWKNDSFFTSSTVRIKLTERIYKEASACLAAEPDSAVVVVKFLRAELTHCTSKSCPVVKVRVGDMEGQTGTPTYLGKRPVWTRTQSMVSFPIAGLNLDEEDLFSIVVVDKNPFTHEESKVATLTNTGDMFQRLVANKRFEDTIQLDGSGGKISCTIKVKFLDPSKKKSLKSPSRQSSPVKLAQLSRLTTAKVSPESASVGLVPAFSSINRFFAMNSIASLDDVSEGGGWDSIEISHPTLFTKGEREAIFRSYFKLE